MLRLRAACLVIATCGAATLAPTAARAEDWTYESDAIEARSAARLRFSGEVGLWVASFDRPARACDTSRLLEAVAPPTPGGFGGSSCTAGRSDEVGLATGVAVAFRVASPVYLTAGLELLYTSPSSSLLKHQVVVPVPLGVLITPYDWSVRPILHATISPILYVTDDARDYTLGADVGLAWRIMTWGDLSLAVGYRGAETMSAWRVEVALPPRALSSDTQGRETLGVGDPACESPRAHVRGGVVASARRASREDKRKRIIDAAVEVFAEKGFFGARVSEIADVAGVADGTIYLYFKSKDDILISLFEEKMAEILSRFLAILAELEDPEAKMRRYIFEHLKLVSEQPKLMQVLTVELRQSARFMKEYSPQAFAKYLALVGGILEEGQKKGVFRRSLDPAVFRRALFGALDELSLEWVLRGSKEAATPNPTYLAEQLGDFIVRGLKA